ncbi:GNAT family N-acetyltransferase [Aquimarina algicola]|uniref:GNAT family N-acetyltransferase n=1 Tax=Aquimarina algicola TaxID=2589995 RepID=A0A504JHH9_9FLAO|nr:GNAT family protein [Aquimarina algicola]TPN86249.1 GNAT family N-acetyltransferase [Aquimarina algicola]
MLDFSNDYVLENDVVRLTPLRLEHVEELYKLSNDPNIWTYLIEKGKDKNELFTYISEAVSNRKNKKEYPFVIYDKIKSAYAGTTRFYDYSEVLKVIKLGHTWYGKDFRGTHVNKNCKYLLLAFAFEELQVERVGFGVHKENKISIAAMKSIGCKQEGILRNFIPSLDGKGRTDIMLLSIIKSEWKTIVKSELLQKLKTTL